VLITGESGVGKELLARAIHGASARGRMPMMTINCLPMQQAILNYGQAVACYTGCERVVCNVKYSIPTHVPKIKAMAIH